MPRDKSKRISGKRVFWSVVAALVALAAIVAVAVWRWRYINAWMVRTTDTVFQLFGWGLVVTAVVVVFIVFAVFMGKASTFFFKLNKWLGFLLIAAGAWGILALIPGKGILSRLSLGGIIGKSIVGDELVWGVLRVAVLFIIGLFMFDPREFCRAIADFFSFVFKAFRRREAPAPPPPAPSPAMTHYNINKPEGLPEPVTRYRPERPAPKPAQVVPGSKHWLWEKLHKPAEEAPGVPTEVFPVKEEAAPAAAETAAEPVETEKEKPAETAAPAAPKKSRQPSAQEVWKKFVESPAQITADGWKLPSVEILDKTPDIDFSQADTEKKARLIEQALASYGVEAKVAQINVGPTVTQFGIEPGWDVKLKEVKEKGRDGDIKVKKEEVSRTRVKVDRITSLSNDLALALAAPSIRIEAPVPGKSIVGIEVPNICMSVVSLRGVVESSSFQKMEAKSKLTVGLGKGAGGEAVVGDLTKMPHLLIAGATGSGKTVCINTIICGLLLYNTPGDLRFIMIDPKRVELTPYNGIPHLATPVIVETNKAMIALRWLMQEMDKRYQTMAAARARNIEAYNKNRQGDRLPYLVLVIDELADLMMTSGEEVEHTLCRLAQLARATGIHLIVATQRPSVDVVTGLIKANFPTRISFAVTSLVDSRTILDIGGAEKLLGRGDMLYMPTEAAKPKRLQGCFVSDPETERLVYFWGSQKREDATQLSLEDMAAGLTGKEGGVSADPMLEEARKLVQEHEHVSTSFLQRHLRIGYPRAARLMEQLELEDESLSAEEPGEEDKI